jgi:molecular chaperone GrpE (heat shock protein)
MEYVRTLDVFNKLQKNILNGVKTPHRISHPVLRRTDTGYALAVFVFFYDSNHIESGVLPRPTKWALADLETGDIIAKYECKEHDFSLASYEELYNVRSNIKDATPEYYEKAFSLLDKVRSELIEIKKLNLEDYDLYLSMITQKIPDEYQRFFFDLSNIERSKVGEPKSGDFDDGETKPAGKENNIADKSLGFDDQSFVSRLDGIQKQIETLQACFNEKIMEDQHKNDLFDKLHKELTEFQNGLLDKVINSMAIDIIQVIDATKKNIDVYEKKEINEENYKRLIRCLKGVTEDLGDVLYRQGIESYSVPGSEIDAKRQKIIEVVGTDNEILNNTIAARTANGFEKEGKVIRPERIKIFKYESDKTKKV